MKLFEVNTHHAYLNHAIRLTNLSGLETIVIKDKYSAIEYTVDKTPTEIKLSAGEHILYAETENGRQQEKVIIEDGIKLGGGTIKKAYVFDNCPWCFIVLNDRTYIYNLVSQKTNLEYNLSPGNISPLSCNYFLFSTGEDYSIFDADSHASMLDFQNYVYGNDHIVAYEDDDKLLVRNYSSNDIIRTISSDSYSINDDVLYFHEDEKLKKINLETEEEEEIRDYRRVSSNRKDFYLFKYVSIEYSIKDPKGLYRYKVTDLMNNNVIMMEIPVPIRKVGMHSFFEDDIEDHLPDNLNLPFHIQLRKDYIDILDVYIEQGKLFCDYKQYGYSYRLDTWYFSGNHSRTMELTSNEPWEFSFETEKKADSEPQNPPFAQAKGSGMLLGKSASGEIYITQDGDSHLFVYFKNQTQGAPILSSLDTSKYLSAYFSSDGKTIVFKKADSTIGALGLDNLEEDKFEIEGFTMPDKIGVNGYLPNWEGCKDGKPVWVDPITLQPVRDLNSKVYKSPDGKFIARNDFVHELFNLLTSKVILVEDLKELKKRLNFSWSSEDDVKKQKREERRKYINDIGFEKFYELYESKYPKIRETFLEKYPKLEGEKIEILIHRRYEEILESDIKGRGDFTSLFIPRKDYLVYKDVTKEIEYKVFLGYNVWYLNYVSFSYDSRYLAFAAKFQEGVDVNNGAGVFGLYDMKDNKEIVRYEKTPLDFCNLNAVWTSLFSKTGAVAFYDSRANAYVMDMNDPSTLRKATGKSVMTFSPSGKYIALSDRNYIRGDGHQPSSNVFIHEVSNIESEIVRYNDVGTGFKGAMTGNTVASVAFSSDENRLLMVGSDGVVVVRNLTLNLKVDISDTKVLPLFFLDYDLPQDMTITELKDEMGNRRFIRCGKLKYRMFIPLSKPINGYDKIIISKSAESYLTKSEDFDVNKLRIACMPMPIAIYPPQTPEVQEMCDDIDSTYLTLWGKHFNGYDYVTIEEPAYTRVNFVGFS